MNRLIGILAGAAIAVAGALAWLTLEPPAVSVSPDKIAASQESQKYLMEELFRLRQELQQLQADRQPREPREERVIDLPEDGSRYHLSLVLSDGWQQHAGHEAHVHGWFGTDARLATLRRQCHWHVYTPSNPWYRAALAHRVGDQTPAVVLQRADGYVVYKASGRNLPANSRALADAIADCCPRPRPRPTPPTPTPVPQPFPTPPVIPDTVPTPDVQPADPVSQEPGLLYYLIPLLAGGGAGGLLTARKAKPF